MVAGRRGGHLERDEAGEVVARRSDRLHTLGLLGGVSVDVLVHAPHMRTRGSSRALHVQPLHVANRLLLAVPLAQHVGCDA